MGVIPAGVAAWLWFGRDPAHALEQLKERLHALPHIFQDCQTEHWEIRGRGKLGRYPWCKFRNNIKWVIK